MIDVIVLAVVQGIAEFLPISSSGHLVILGSALQRVGGDTSTLTSLRDSATLEIILHAGTLGSILLIYWRRILDLLWRDRKVLPLLVVGTIPAAVFGLTVKQAFPGILKSTPLAASMLLVTGVFLVVLGRLRRRDGDYRALNWRSALIIGCFQAFAILPGISRSGSTILGGRLVGLKTDDSVTFSFLLAIPAILGATVLAVRDVWEAQVSGQPIPAGIAALAIGAAVSFVVGVAALRWLIGWSRLDRLHWFAWWCFPVGIVALGSWASGIIG